MKNYLSAAEEAQFREDIRAVLQEAEGGMTENEVIERVRLRELQRLVDGMVEDGLAVKVENGLYVHPKYASQHASNAE